MGSVVDLACPEAVERAWQAYVDLAVQLRTDPHLLADRDFNQRMATAHERWRKLFLMREGA